MERGWCLHMLAQLRFWPKSCSLCYIHHSSPQFKPAYYKTKVLVVRGWQWACRSFTHFPSPNNPPFGIHSINSHIRTHNFFVGLAYQGKDIVFRFIIEYSSFRDFGHLGSIGLFVYEDFWKMIFWLVLKLELVIELWYLEGCWFLLVDFFWKIMFLHGEIFEFP
jgi:hypothetical protein